MDGYHFRSLTTRNHNGSAARFTFVAYPAEYRSSGVKTFAVNEDGIVYAKDLGPNTPRSAKALSRIRPNSTWAVEK